MGVLPGAPGPGRVVVLITWCLALGIVARATEAAVLTVDGSCSLADAIVAANVDSATGGCPAGEGPDEIHLTGEVVLTETDTGGAEGGLPPIVSEITLQGFGHTIVRDDGADADASVLTLGPGGKAEIFDVSLAVGQPTVGAGLDGATGSRALCAERTSSQRVLIQLAGETSWNCLGHGLVVTPGNVVLQKVLAEALASEVGGWTDGLNSVDVRCKNDSTGESVRFQPGDGVASWSCSANGLTVTPGDGLRLVISGVVE